MELFSENRIGELEEKIDSLIKNYKTMKDEREQFSGRIQALEAENSALKERMTETKGERELIIEKVTRILEKVEQVEV
jgi:uncharacterized coiled-coil DUF342 family protein